jgi:two-component system, NarL family, nitrate/nitrite response regulator NarL
LRGLPGIGNLDTGVINVPKQPGPVNVLLVDDHAVIRRGLRLLIETDSKFKVCGECADGRGAVEEAGRLQPDVIVLDVDLAGEDGLAYIPQLLAAAKRARVLILTASNEPEVHTRAIMTGALGVIHKEKAPEVMMKAIEKVNEGEVWFDRAAMGHLLTEMSRGRQAGADPEAAKIAELTEREREVIKLIGEGLKNRQIAERMFISETTVRHHLTSIFNKLDVSDRLELVIYAYRNGLADPPK